MYTNVCRGRIMEKNSDQLITSVMDNLLSTVKNTPGKNTSLFDADVLEGDRSWIDINLLKMPLIYYGKKKEALDKREKIEIFSDIMKDGQNEVKRKISLDPAKGLLIPTDDEIIHITFDYIISLKTMLGILPSGYIPIPKDIYYKVKKIKKGGGTYAKVKESLERISACKIYCENYIYQLIAGFYLKEIYA